MRAGQPVRVDASRRCGGWGHGVPVTPSDVRAVVRAVSEGWPVPDDVCAEVVARLVESVSGSRARLAVRAAAALAVLAHRAGASPRAGAHGPRGCPTDSLTGLDG